MTEPNVRPYEAEMTYDLPLYRELVKHNSLYFLRAKLAYVIIAGIVIAYAYLFRDYGKSYVSAMILLFLGVFWGTRLLTYFLNRKGGKNYKRMLSANGDKPAQRKYAFLSDGIHIHNTYTDGHSVLPYSQVRGVYETIDLLVIILQYQQTLPLEKASLTGGPVSTFVEKLLHASPNARRKRLSSLLPGKLIEGSMILFSVVCVILSLWWSSPIQNLYQSNLAINNSMSYYAITQELEEFGIHDIPESAFLELAEFEQEYAAYFPQGSVNRCMELLCWAGMGTYHPDTYQWMPSECGVFWFDTEAYDLENMYTNLLMGIRALDPQTLNFSNLQEDITQVNWAAGSGTQTIRFEWMGQTHTLTAEVNYDWYDLSVLNDLNSIIRTQTGGKQLYFAWDQGQGFLVFFADSTWATKFTLATGITLRTNPLTLGAIF